MPSSRSSHPYSTKDSSNRPAASRCFFRIDAFPVAKNAREMSVTLNWADVGSSRLSVWITGPWPMRLSSVWASKCACKNSSLTTMSLSIKTMSSA